MKIRKNARMPHTVLSTSEATEIAKQWWGEHAEVFVPDPETDTDFYSVGYWSGPLPSGDDIPDEAWPDLHIKGSGVSFAAAFREADPKRWSAYLLHSHRRRRICAGAAQRRP